jgi:hypothetical protein
LPISPSLSLFPPGVNAIKLFVILTDGGESKLGYLLLQASLIFAKLTQMEYHSIGRRPGFPSKIKLAFKKTCKVILAYSAPEEMKKKKL